MADLTPEQLTALYRDICPHCAADKPLRKRDDTGEYVHDFTTGTGFSHTLCLASHLRTKNEVLDG